MLQEAFTFLYLPCFFSFVIIICLTFISKKGLRGHQPDGSREIPSPWAWPIFGNLPNMIWAGYKPEDLMMKWANRYGDIFSFQLGFQPVVVLNNFKLISKAWHHPKLQDRAAPLVYVKALGRGNGVTFANSEQWKETRTFVLNMFRKLGVGKSDFETVVRNEGAKLLNEISRQGHTLDVSYIFSMSSCNIISKLVFNQQLEYTDPALQEQVATVLKHFQLAGPGSLNSMTPIFAHFRVGPGEWIVKNYKTMKRLWSRQIQNHVNKEQVAHGQHEDIVDAYLEELQKHLQDGTPTNFKMHNLLWLLRDLYLAGTETTSTTLKWAMLFLVTHPDSQNKCHEELDKNFTADHTLSYADRKKLPYTSACIMESLRLGDILPLGVAHEAAEDVRLEKYFIPKGTIVASNVRAVSMDPVIFPDPKRFNPERFITPDGNYRTVDEMMPFGLGKRICLGEQLARIELFLWLTHILQRFEVKPADETLPDFSVARTGLVRSPLPFKVKFVERPRRKFTECQR